jgi:hypothetical protein
LWRHLFVHNPNLNLAILISFQIFAVSSVTIDDDWWCISASISAHLPRAFGHLLHAASKNLITIDLLREQP